jgi:hypothetical protein
MTKSNPIYFATICIEPNRWSEGREPAVEVSAWIERALDDGFDGVELWENHWCLASPAERTRLESLADGPLAGESATGETAGDHAVSPASCILSTYFSFDRARIPTGVQEPQQILRAMNALQCGGIKFNVGKQNDSWDEYVRESKRWLPQFAAAGAGGRVRLICECHGGTVLERPESADRYCASLGDTAIEYVVHPISDESLERWLETGRVGHLHIQSRSDRLRNVPHAAERIEKALDGAPGASLSVEFSEGVGARGETPERIYSAALDDLRFVKKILGRR